MPDSPDKEELLASLVDEYLEAMRRGEAPPLSEYVEAHPECGAELHDLLTGVVDMEALSVSRLRSAGEPMEQYPETLGGYRLLERIGAGGMGTVFRALQESLNREVAVKILSPAWNADSRHCEAFENESRVIARLHHTNIVEVYGSGHEGDYRYYVMSLVQGQGINPSCIRKAFPGVPFDMAVAQVGLQAARALAYAHSCGILHRDVKPGNLLLDSDGVLRVGDFGLATVLNNGENAPLVTQSHDGTLRYMPPERLIKGENSFAGDQYSLGVTLYELLSNRPAFRETEPGKLIHSICNNPLHSLRNEGELGAIINKSISFDPSDRYATMADMAADLNRYLAGEPVKARPVSWLRRYAMWVRRKPAVAAWSHAAALLVFLLFGSITWGYAAESKQRKLAERSATIAGDSLHQIFASMANRDSGDNAYWQPSKADVLLLQQLMPYYEEIAAMAESHGDKMADACETLAIISLQTKDFATAEIYFSRALALFPAYTVDYLRNLNGFCSALYEQNRQKEAEKLLQEAVAQVDTLTDSDAKLEIIRSYQMLADGARSRWFERRGYSRDSKRDRNRRKGHDVRIRYQKQALLLMKDILAQKPDDENLQQRRVELLMHVQRADMQQILLEKGQDMGALLNDLLLQYPDNMLFKRAFVQWSLRPFSKPDLATLERAARYSRSLLAEVPGSTQLLMQYLSIRERYAVALASAGEHDRAERENAMTLGVLSLITTRAEYTPDIRERLAVLVSMHPKAADARSLREAEISLLLDNMDEKRLKDVRDRIRKIRSRRRSFFVPRERPAR